MTTRGWDLARATNDERSQEIFRQAIRDIPPYMIALEWVFHQKMDIATNVDLAAHWYEHCRDDLGTDNEDTIRRQAGCFMNLAEAAGLGNFYLGRRGQPTRFEVNNFEVNNKEALDQAIAQVSLAAEPDVAEVEAEPESEPRDIEA